MGLAAAMMLMDARWASARDAQAIGLVEGSTQTLPAVDLRSGDYLPPQPALDHSAWRGSGFRIGYRPRDVRTDVPLLQGRVLLFGPLGVLDFLAESDLVSVVRP